MPAVLVDRCVIGHGLDAVARRNGVIEYTHPSTTFAQQSQTVNKLYVFLFCHLFSFTDSEY